MVEATFFKMPIMTKVFNKNQKVWVQQRTGNQAVKVIGRYRGNKRRISFWYSWERKPLPEFRTILVDKDFADRLELDYEQLT